MINIQEDAYDLLKKTHQTRLPIEEKRIVAALGIAVHPYIEVEDLLATLGILEEAESLQGICFIHEGKQYICYRDNLSSTKRREVIMHECGHLYLEHLSYGTTRGKGLSEEKQNEQEAEADEFARAILAPVPLLRKKGVTTSEDIQRLARVSKEHADAVLPLVFDDSTSRRVRFRAAKAPLVGAVSIVAALSVGVGAWHYTTQPPAKTPVEPPTAPTTSSQNTTQHPDDTATYYWTPGGEVYHTREDCGALKNSSTILSGTLEQAQSTKSRLCSKCD